MNLLQRSYTKELLDEDDIPFEDIRQNMKELNVINSWLGGHAITLNGFKQILGKRKAITVCEIGCGGGDNLHAIVKYCIKKNIAINCIGIDIKPSCIEYAKQQWSYPQQATWVADDYRNAGFETKPDIIFSSLFCHHFTEDELAYQMTWMKRNAAVGFFINDLQRHILAYYSIKVLTRLFSSSYLVQNDAPLSVTRGFSKADWIHIFNKAGIHQYTIQWKWAFRYLITCFNAQG